MKTLIFESYEDFLNREDKNVNGVSKDFAEKYRDFENNNVSNLGCWNCRGCSYCSYCRDCSYCSDCSDCSDCSYCRDCSDCSYCRDCSGCSYCSDCSYCRGCSGCSYCSDCSYCRDCGGCSYCSYCRDCSYCSYCHDRIGGNQPPSIPQIKNIHSKVFLAASADSALNMESWHSCKTTHCRAGWVVHLAGEEGYAAEEYYGTCLAAQLIYRESGYRINPARFFDPNEESLAHMKELAENEQAQEA